MDDRNKDIEQLEEKLRHLGAQIPEAKNKASFKAEFLQMVDDEAHARLSKNESPRLIELFEFKMKRFAAAMTAMATLLGGAAYASQSALPNTPLYKVKRAIESAKLAFPMSDEALVQATIDQLDERLDELSKIKGTGMDKEFLTKEIDATVSRLQESFEKLPGHVQKEIAIEIKKVIRKRDEQIKKIDDQIKPGNKGFIDKVKIPKAPTGPTVQNGQTEQPVLAPATQDPMPPISIPAPAPQTKERQKGSGSSNNGGDITDIFKPEAALKASIKALIKKQQNDLKFIAKVLLPTPKTTGRSAKDELRIDEPVAETRSTSTSIDDAPVDEEAKQDKRTAGKSREKCWKPANEDRDTATSASGQTVKESDQRTDVKPQRPGKRQRDMKNVIRSLYGSPVDTYIKEVIEGPETQAY